MQSNVSGTGVPANSLDLYEVENFEMGFRGRNLIVQVCTGLDKYKLVQARVPGKHLKHMRNIGQLKSEEEGKYKFEVKKVGVERRIQKLKNDTGIVYLPATKENYQAAMRNEGINFQNQFQHSNFQPNFRELGSINGNFGGIQNQNAQTGWGTELGRQGGPTQCDPSNIMGGVGQGLYGSFGNGNQLQGLPTSGGFSDQSQGILFQNRSSSHGQDGNISFEQGPNQAQGFGQVQSTQGFNNFNQGYGFSGAGFNSGFNQGGQGFGTNGFGNGSGAGNGRGFNN